MWEMKVNVQKIVNMFKGQYHNIYCTLLFKLHVVYNSIISEYIDEYNK